MEIVRRLRMVGETIRLDHRHFIDCTFTDCVLEYGGSEIVLERTRFNGCRHALYDRAYMTLQYLRAVGVMPRTELATVSDLCYTVH